MAMIQQSNNKRNPNRKRGKMKIQNEREIKSVVHKVIKANRILKYFETFINATNVTLAGTTNRLTSIPQGIAQGDRQADTIYICAIEHRISVATANSDIYSNVRLTLFGFREIDSPGPTIGTIYQNPSTAGGVYSFFQNENRKTYKIFSDRVFNLVGTATNPTATSQIRYEGKRSFSPEWQIAYGLGSTTGSNNVYLASVSDSLIAPFPVLIQNWRVWYYDEMG
jgi:hypothetical protein